MCLLVKEGTDAADGTVEVKFKPVGGREDQAGGVVWRWKDGNNYYVARANALENNVALYYTWHGSRKTPISLAPASPVWTKADSVTLFDDFNTNAFTPSQ